MDPLFHKTKDIFRKELHGSIYNVIWMLFKTAHFHFDKLWKGNPGRKCFSPSPNSTPWWFHCFSECLYRINSFCFVSHTPTTTSVSNGLSWLDFSHSFDDLCKQICAYITQGSRLSMLPAYLVQNNVNCKIKRRKH